MFDVAIIGAGPAGLQAAILLAAEGKRVLLLERSQFVGGQIGHSALVENLLGHGNGISGEQYRAESLKQLSKFGVRLITGYPVVMLEQVQENLGSSFSFMLNGHYFAHTVILALGLSPRAPAGFEVLPDCSMRFVPLLIDDVQTGQAVLVVGGGNSAAQAALHYAARGAAVQLLAQEPIEQTMDGYYVRQLFQRTNVFIGEYLGCTGNAGTALVAMRGLLDDLYQTAFQHVHFLVGSLPDTSWLPSAVERTEHGFLVTDKQRMTTLPGLFAIGDCVDGAVRRVSCALGAAGEVARFVNQYRRRVEDERVRELTPDTGDR